MHVYEYIYIYLLVSGHRTMKFMSPSILEIFRCCQQGRCHKFNIARNKRAVKIPDSDGVDAAQVINFVRAKENPISTPTKLNFNEYNISSTHL